MEKSGFVLRGTLKLRCLIISNKNFTVKNEMKKNVISIAN